MSMAKLRNNANHTKARAIIGWILPFLFNDDFEAKKNIHFNIHHLLIISLLSCPFEPPGNKTANLVNMAGLDCGDVKI